MSPAFRSKVKMSTSVVALVSPLTQPPAGSAWPASLGSVSAVGVPLRSRK